MRRRIKIVQELKELAIRGLPPNNIQVKQVMLYIYLIAYFDAHLWKKQRAEGLDVQQIADFTAHLWQKNNSVQCTYTVLICLNLLCVQNFPRIFGRYRRNFSIILSSDLWKIPQKLQYNTIILIQSPNSIYQINPEVKNGRHCLGALSH